MNLHDEFDDDGGRDLLGDMAPASFHASDDWWRRQYAALDEAGRGKLVRGELVYVALAADGLEQVPLKPPAWLFGDAAPLA